MCDVSRGYCILPNKCMQISHWIILSSVSSICLFVCPVQQSSILRNEQKRYSNAETDEDKWSHGALFWLFSLCQFRDSTVDSRRTCYCAVTICHFCTVIVSFCGNASELIWAESIRTKRGFICSRDGENESVVLRYDHHLCICETSALIHKTLSDVACYWAIEAVRPLPYLTALLKVDSRGQRWHICFPPGCRVAADSVPCQPQCPRGDRKWQTEMMPWCDTCWISDPRSWVASGLSTSQHHSSPSDVSRVRDRLIVDLQVLVPSLSAESAADNTRPSPWWFQNTVPEYFDLHQFWLALN